MLPAKHIRCLWPLLGLFSIAAQAQKESNGSELWNRVQSKRAELSSFHQEFEVTDTTRLASGSRSSKSRLIVDGAKGEWRQQSISGSGVRVVLFHDGQSYSFEEGGDEYVRKAGANDENQPLPYGLKNVDWARARETERRPCGVEGTTQPCVVIQAPLLASLGKPDVNHPVKTLQGSVSLLVELETGLVISASAIQTMESRQTTFETTISFGLRRMKYGGSPDAALVHLPSTDMTEVKDLGHLDAAKIRKQFGGKAAPELMVTDLQHNSISLGALKGKTVLLDFWTTWCGPCRADAPALDKLYRKYGDRDLKIIGISENEDRSVVEKFLSEHPHPFPVVLTTENDLPRPYQIRSFPTYIVIDRDGNLVSAIEGDQGFGELRKLLKKAGIEAD